MHVHPNGPQPVEDDASVEVVDDESDDAAPVCELEPTVDRVEDVGASNVVLPPVCGPVLDDDGALEALTQVPL